MTCMDSGNESKYAGKDLGTILESVDVDDKGNDAGENDVDEARDVGQKGDADRVKKANSLMGLLKSKLGHSYKLGDMCQRCQNSVKET